MIEIWPAIDLIDSKSVRLTEGDYNTSTEMERTPEEAIAFYSGFSMVKRIHIVDLMGALKKGPEESAFIRGLIKNCPLPVEIGGGIRSREIIESYLEAGASYLIVGTRGLKEPEWLSEMANAFPGKIYLGLDAREEMVSVNGWTEETGETIYQVVERSNRIPLGGIIFTDISKDGRMSGPNFELTAKLSRLSVHPVTASGGVRDMDDIMRLDSLGVHAAIVGKAANTPEFWRDVR